MGFLNLLSGVANRIFNKKANTVSEAARYNDEGKKFEIGNDNFTSKRYTFDSRTMGDDLKHWHSEDGEDSPSGFFRGVHTQEQKDKIIEGMRDAIIRRNIEKQDKEIAEGKRKRNTAVHMNNIKKAQADAEEQFDKEYETRSEDVPSTAIKWFSYNPKNEELMVQFVGGKGKKYYYPHVPQEVIDKWMRANSKGEFFMKHIHDQYTLNPGHRPQGKKAVKRYKKIQKHFKNMGWKQQMGQPKDGGIK